MKKLFTLIAAALLALGANADQTTVASWEEGTKTGTWSLEGSSTSSITGLDGDVSLKYNKNSTSVKAIKFATGMVSGGAFVGALKLTAELKKGDVITIQPFTMMSNSDFTGSSKYANLLIYKSASKSLYTTGSTATARTVTDGHEEEGAPKTFTYTLEEDLSEIYFGRGGNTNIGVMNITITRGDAPAPTPATESSIDLTGLNTLDAIKAVSNYTGTEEGWKIAEGTTGEGDSKTEWSITTGGTAVSVTFTNFPMTLSYTNSSTKSGFIKTYPNYFQFNAGKIAATITCSAGQYITIYPVAYDKSSVTQGATVSGADVTSFTIPNNTADPINLKASGTKVVITETGAFCISKMTITNEKPTAINTVSAASAKANNGVVKTANYIMKDGKKYNFAGQQMK